MLSEPGADYADIIERAAYMAVGEPTAIEDYTVQARDFLAKARRYLAEGDLHQASEKGWRRRAHGQGSRAGAGLELRHAC